LKTFFPNCWFKNVFPAYFGIEISYGNSGICEIRFIGRMRVLRSWVWRRHVLPKRQLTFNGLDTVHGTIGPMRSHIVQFTSLHTMVLICLQSESHIVQFTSLHSMVLICLQSGSHIVQFTSLHTMVLICLQSGSHIVQFTSLHSMVLICLQSVK
jgi:hypothetical protein